jgi:hypothetical protein
MAQAKTTTGRKGAAKPVTKDLQAKKSEADKVRGGMLGPAD